MGGRNFKKRGYGLDNQQVKAMWESICGGKPQKPVFFCEDGSVWSTAITTGKNVVSGEGFYVPQYQWDIRTSENVIVLFPGHHSFGMMNEGIHQSMKASVVDDESPAQFFLVQDDLLIVKSGIMEMYDLAEAQLRFRGGRMPLYGVTADGQLDFVISHGEIIREGHDQWKIHFSGYVRTTVDPFHREILDLPMPEAVAV